MAKTSKEEKPLEQYEKGYKDAAKIYKGKMKDEKCLEQFAEGYKTGYRDGYQEAMKQISGLLIDTQRKMEDSGEEGIQPRPGIRFWP